MDYTNLKERMEKSIGAFKEKLSEIRAGRANPAILNKVKIDYYGTPTPINQVAGVSVPEARLIVIQPWDVSVLKDILASDIGLNPNNDGKVIRLAFPELTEERRKELAKEIRKIAEEAKVAIRAIRRDGIDEAKAKQKNSEITEDELKSAETEIQKITDKYIDEIDKILADKEKEKMKFNKENMPKSIAIIMDGNRRWAKAQGKPVSFGHKEGAKTLEKIVRYANKIGLEYITVYAFSTENWKRAEDEVKTLMLLLQAYLDDYAKRADSENIKVKILGDITALSKGMQKSIRECMERTKNNTGVTFNIALNYGGRDEIVKATRKIAEQVKQGKIDVDEINEKMVSDNLYTAGEPDPDLVIRTSGEIRLSGFLPWQSVYSELLFVNKNWPDFTENDLDEAIIEYQKRTRKFGAN